MSLCLWFEGLKCISINKISFLLWMCMKINIKTQFILLKIMSTNLFHSICWRLKLWIRILIKSIQILAKRVHSVMTIRHTIRIEHRNHLKNKILSQKVSSCISNFFKDKYLDNKNFISPLNVWLDGASAGWTRAEIITTFFYAENFLNPLLIFYGKKSSSFMFYSSFPYYWLVTVIKWIFLPS